jgi:hypothetical protein
MHLRVFTLTIVLTCWTGAVHARQGVTLQFNAGQVSLSAQNAPIRAILAEWARLGNVTIVNADRVAGPPVTLELTGVSERQALDVVLRSVAGYIVAPRPAGSAGSSAFDRIMILPTSAAPRNPAPAVAAGPRGPIRPGVIQRPIEGIGDVEPVIDVDPLEDPSALNQGPRVVQPFVPRPPVPEPTPLEQVVEENQAQEAGEQPGVATTPGNPFGVPAGSSATPGVTATPVPQVRTPQVQPRPAPNRVQ